jgi:hypothetical protein
MASYAVADMILILSKGLVSQSKISKSGYQYEPSWVAAPVPVAFNSPE